MMRLVDAAKAAHIRERTLRDWCYAHRLTWVKRGWVIYVNWTEVAQLAEWQHTKKTQRLAKPQTRRYDGVTSPALSAEASPAVDSTR